MAAVADIYTERDQWTFPLAWSVALHGFLLAAILIYGAVLNRNSGTDWGGGGGGGGDAMRVGMIANIPLPAPTTATQNILANESKGQTQTLPKAVEKTPEPETIPIPDKNSHIKPAPKPRTTTQQKPVPMELTDNRVPYGQGGQVAGPYSTFSVSGSKGGFSFGGGGDFGAKYAWYVQAMQRKITDNWMKYEVDPRVPAGRRVYVTFDIDRTGHPSNVQMSESSGVPSLDQSALRTLQRIDTFGSLPPDYRGNKVAVEFWFEK